MDKFFHRRYETDHFKKIRESFYLGIFKKNEAFKVEEKQLIESDNLSILDREIIPICKKQISISYKRINKLKNEEIEANEEYEQLCGPGKTTPF